MPATAERIKPKEARAHLDSGEAILVCAYDEVGKCRANHIDGAITFQEFKSRSRTLPKDQEIIFYCA